MQNGNGKQNKEEQRDIAELIPFTSWAHKSAALPAQINDLGPLAVS